MQLISHLFLALALVSTVNKAWGALNVNSVCWDLKGPGKSEMQGGKVCHSASDLLPQSNGFLSHFEDICKMYTEFLLKTWEKQICYLQ